MLSQIELGNFKAFASAATLRLRPLTLFVGTNGSGKSSILDAIGLLAQSAPSAERAADIQWQGSLVDLGVSGEPAVHKSEDERHLTIAVEVEAGEQFHHWYRRQYDEPEAHVETLGYRLILRAAAEEWKHELIVDGKVAVSNSTVPLGRGPLKKGTGSLLECNFPASAERVFEPAAAGPAVLSPKLFMATRAVGGNEITPAAQRAFLHFGVFTSYIGAYLRHRVFVLDSGRVPKRETPQPKSGPLVVGRHGEHTFSVLSAIFAHAKHGAQAEKIRQWAAAFGMESLSAGWIREELLHAGYVDSSLQTPLAIEFGGSGAQQVLPIITQIFCAPKHSVILMEEPEAGLHPAVQAQLAALFADAVAHGHQLLITTHSEALLRGLSQLCEAGQVRQEDVVAYEFSKSHAGALVEECSLHAAAAALQCPDISYPGTPQLVHKANA
ncbi:MAG TPA: AAA family ATPase [Terriglobales bacterium]|nr:AAA family ATPase [Terriglobales bacterium]